MNIAKGKIGNALTSVADDHTVAAAGDIYDEYLSLYQNDINYIAVEAEDYSAATAVLHTDADSVMVNGEDVAVRKKSATIYTPLTELSISGSPSFFSIAYITGDNVEDLSYAFSCASLREIDFGDFDFGNVTDMEGMLSGAGISTIVCGNWDTGNVTTFRDMFRDCRRMSSFDVGIWDIGNVTDVGGMFAGCYLSTGIDVEYWNTSGLTTTEDMFNGCRMLSSLNLSAWKLPSLTGMSGMFSDCLRISSLKVSPSFFAGECETFDFGGLRSWTDIAEITKLLNVLPDTYWPKTLILDGTGAFSVITEAEIAIAVDKGWTVVSNSEI